jgi:hypothetical protein
MPSNTLDRAADAVEYSLAHGLESAMNLYNKPENE